MSDNSALLHDLEKLVRRNTALISAGGIPRLMRSGVRYQREPKGREEWLDCTEVLRARVGDCEDLACWLAGELRANGDHRARAVLKLVRPGLKHCLVMDGRGNLRDPSRALGMGKRHR